MPHAIFTKEFSVEAVDGTSGREAVGLPMACPSLDGAITAPEIRVVRTANGMVEVLAGLRAGDKVVTRGTLFIDRAARPLATVGSSARFGMVTAPCVGLPYDAD